MSTTRVALALVLVLVAACRGAGGEDPEAQQLARINRELALLGERVDALSRRVAELERAAPSAAARPAPEPAATPGPEPD